MPLWTCTSEPCDGSYRHSVNLKVAGEEFWHEGMLTKSDLKKVVAEQAVAFFEESKIEPFFVTRVRNHVSLLQSLCQMIQKPLPEYSIESTTVGFVGSVSVGPYEYTNKNGSTNKKFAKVNCHKR